MIMYEEVKMLFNAVLLEEVVKDKTPGGLIIPPEKQDSNFKKGIVLKKGPGMWNSDMFVSTTVEPDDIVLFSSRHSEKLTYEGKNVFVVREDYIIAVVGKK